MLISHFIHGLSKGLKTGARIMAAGIVVKIDIKMTIFAGEITIAREINSEILFDCIELIADVLVCC